MCFYFEGIYHILWFPPQMCVIYTLYTSSGWSVENLGVDLRQKIPISMMFWSQTLALLEIVYIIDLFSNSVLYQVFKRTTCFYCYLGK